MNSILAFFNEPDVHAVILVFLGVVGYEVFQIIVAKARGYVQKTPSKADDDILDKVESVVDAYLKKLEQTTPVAPVAPPTPPTA